jgi:hypothetical protein
MATRFIFAGCCARAASGTGTFMLREPDSFPRACSACSKGQVGHLLRSALRRGRRASTCASTSVPVCAGCGGEWTPEKDKFPLPKPRQRSMRLMSAFERITDSSRTSRHVRFVPSAEVQPRQHLRNASAVNSLLLREDNVRGSFRRNMLDCPIS